MLFSFLSQFSWNNKALDQADWSPANTALPVLWDVVYLLLQAAGRSDENITSAPKPLIFLPRNLKTLEMYPQLHKENENSFSHTSTELEHVLGLHKAWQDLKPLLSAAREKARFSFSWATCVHCHISYLGPGGRAVPVGGTACFPVCGIYIRVCTCAHVCMYVRAFFRWSQTTL